VALARDINDVEALETHEVMALLLPQRDQKERFAKRVHRSYSTVVKYCEAAGADPALHGCQNPLDVVLRLGLVSREPRAMLSYLAAQFGLKVVDAAGARVVDQAEVAKSCNTATKETAEALMMIAAALTDGHIDPYEIPVLRKEIIEAVDALNQTLTDVEQLKTATKDDA
jgi:riboflavin synthase